MTQVNKCLISQGFGLNGNPSYAAAGQTGHTGVDEVCGYGTPVYALKKGRVYKILDDRHPAGDGSGYWAVFIIAEGADGQWCEWQIGHLSKILCKDGDLVEPWTVIGEEGNHGKVYTGDIEITKAMQDAGDHRASHRHWNKKILKRQTFNQREEDGGVHLTTYGWEAYRDPQGCYYQVQNYYNGYNGSVDPAGDLDIGYAAINAHLNPPEPELTPVEEKMVEDGIKVAQAAVKFPWLRALAMKILQGLASFLSTKK